jgi:AraC-like DNA-binding protein
MVAEPRCTCTVVRDGDRRGDRQACWRLVEEGTRVVGDVRGGGPERFCLIVQMLASETGERVSTVLLDVLAVKLADRMPDGAVSMQDVAIQDVATHDMRRGALVRRIRAFIDSHLGDPELTPAAVAAAHHISLRYLHKLFEPEGHGVAGLIRQRRLERCRQDLLDPAQVDRPVAGIAARWGFSSAAHFSRVFREAYGLPPAAFRRAYRLGAASSESSTSGNATNRTRSRRASSAGGSVAAA